MFGLYYRIQNIIIPNESAELSGDEPKQYAMKFRDTVVAVSESRNTGIPQMLKSYPNIETIILHQKVYFTYYKYYQPYYMYNGGMRLELTPDKEIILMSAIANTDYLESYLSERCTILDTIKYEDHHFFTERDIETIVRIYQEEENKDIILITTEKDATRLHVHNEVLIKERIPIFILPIEVAFHFDEKETFDQDIKDFLLEFKS